MVFIEGGSFVMGSNKPIVPQDGEGPARKVSLDEYFIDKHEVSNAEFDIFVKDTGYVTEVTH